MVTIKAAKKGEPEYFGSWDDLVKYAKSKGDGFTVKFRSKEGDPNNDIEFEIMPSVSKAKD